MAVPTPTEIVADMQRIKDTCQALARGELTRGQCRHKLLTECKMADHNIDALLDAYDQGRTLQ
jgi:hypothetical protein